MLNFNEISDVKHRDFEEVMKIYKSSFSAQGREPDNIIRKRIQEHIFRLMVGYWEGRAIAMSFFYRLKDKRFFLLAYIAISKKFQNRGIGSKLMKHMLHVVKKDAKGQYLLMEVESPKYGKSREEKEKRVQFYKRLGAKELKGIYYTFPPHPGNKPTEMILMLIPNYPNGKMNGNLVKKLISMLYTDLYRKDKSDNLLKSMISNVPPYVELA